MKNQNAEQSLYGRPPFISKWFKTHNIVDLTVNLLIVAINNTNQFSKLVMGGAHGRFPDLSLLAFAIAHQAEYIIVPAVYSKSERCTDCCRKTLP